MCYCFGEFQNTLPQKRHVTSGIYLTTNITGYFTIMCWEAVLGIVNKGKRKHCFEGQSRGVAYYKNDRFLKTNEYTRNIFQFICLICCPSSGFIISYLNLCILLPNFLFILRCHSFHLKKKKDFMLLPLLKPSSKKARFLFYDSIPCAWSWGRLEKFKDLQQSSINIFLLQLFFHSFIFIPLVC